VFSYFFNKSFNSFRTASSELESMSLVESSTFYAAAAQQLCCSYAVCFAGRVLIARLGLCLCGACLFRERWFANNFLDIFYRWWIVALYDSLCLLVQPFFLVRPIGVKGVLRTLPSMPIILYALKEEQLPDLERILYFVVAMGI